VSAAEGRVRRSGTELRTLILEAANQIFAARGYEATRTKDIAAAAGVTEATIYRHYGTKEALFEASIAERFHGIFASFMRSWHPGGPEITSNVDVVRHFVEQFYDFVQNHRSLVMAYLTYTEYTPLTNSSVLSTELDNVEEAMRREVKTRGLRGLDVTVAVRCSTAMVLSLALHGQLLFPTGPKRPTRERIVQEAVAYSLYGITGR
jgi:AcrR family transcriptional regulator